MDLRIRNYEAFSFIAQFGQPQFFLFLVFFGSNFLVTYSLVNFQLNYQMTQAIVYMYFTRGGFKKKVPQWLKKFQPILIIIISSTKFGMNVLYQDNFKILQLDLPNNA